MNDIHVTFFILLTVAVYGIFRKRIQEGLPNHSWLLLVGISAGLAMGSKWSGIYVLFAVWVMEVLRILQSPRDLRARLKKIITAIFFLGLIPGLIYLASFTHMFLQGKTLVCLGNQVKQGECYCSQESSAWVVFLSDLFPSRQAQFEALEARGGCKRLISHFSELHHQILYYQTHLTATHPYQSVPWQWVLDLRPVWQYVDYEKVSAGITGNIYNAGNPILYWVGLFSVISVTVLFLTQRVHKNSTLQEVGSWKIGFLLLVYFIVWAPWNFSPRIMFFYHYAPAVPIMAILAAYFFSGISKTYKQSRPLLAGTVVLIALVFLWMYPLNTGLPMPAGYFSTIFKLFPSWK